MTISYVQEIYLINRICPIFIFILGLLGNLCGFYTTYSKRVKKFGPIFVIRYLFIINTLFISKIILNYTNEGFSLSENLASNTSCRLHRYVSYTLAALPPNLLAYIAIDRYQTLKDFHTKSIFKRKFTQLFFCSCLTIFNLTFYLQIYFQSILHEDEFEIFYQATNVSFNKVMVYCGFIDEERHIVLTYLDHINYLILPTLIMLICAVKLISVLLKINGLRIKKRIFKERELAITTIVLIICYIIFNFPYAIAQFVIEDFQTSYIYYLCFYLFYAEYSFIFYVILFTNRFYRKTFINLISKKFRQFYLN